MALSTRYWKKAVAFLAFTTLICLPVIAFAQSPSSSAPFRPISGAACALGLPCAPAGGGADGVLVFIRSLVNVLLGLVGLIAVIFVIYGGVRYIISMGDEQAVETAKKIILYAILGLIIIGLAAVLVNFIIEAIRSV